MLRLLTQFPEITAVLSEKQDGSMKVFPERPEENRKNREGFFAGQGIPAERVVCAELVHGTKVGIVTAQNASHNRRSSFIGNGGGERVIPGADALVTREKNLFLSVTVADCLPIFLYDPVTKVIGIAHAGWRGMMDGVIGNTVEAMIGCGAKAENISVAFGPSIQKCHFEIGEDVLPRFAGYAKHVIERDDTRFIDLQGIVTEQLQNAGIQEMNIAASDLCTFCKRDRFFSYRRDKPEQVEAMAAVISMR